MNNDHYFVYNNTVAVEEPFNDRNQFVLEPVEKEKRSIVACALLKVRNPRIFLSSPTTLQQVVKMILCSINIQGIFVTDAYNGAQLKNQGVFFFFLITYVSWLSPHFGMLKINFDDSVCGPSAVGGFLISDRPGKMLSAYGQEVTSSSFPFAKLFTAWSSGPATTIQ